MYIAIIANKSLSAYRKWQGEYTLVEHVTRELLTYINKNYAFDFEMAGLLYSELADIYFMRNRLTEALELALKGIDIAGENQWVLSENAYILSKIYYALERDFECNEATFVAEQKISDQRYFDLNINVECFKAEMLLSINEHKKVAVWLDEILPKVKENLYKIYPNVYLILIRYLIASKELVKAREIISLLKNCADDYGFYRLKAELNVLNAKVFENQGFSKQSSEQILEAVELSWKERLVRLFLKDEKFLKYKLTELSNIFEENKKFEQANFINLILEGYMDTFDKENFCENSILSQRELEILKLIELGYTNTEISGKLFLSINTVKTHLKNIFIKLDVSNRTGALAKAKIINLL